MGQNTFIFQGTNTKNVHRIFYLLPPLKGLFLWISKLRLNFHSGNTLTLKKWLTAKRVDNFKYNHDDVSCHQLSIKRNG